MATTAQNATQSRDVKEPPAAGTADLATQGTAAVRNWGFRDDVVALAKHINSELTDGEMRVFLYEAWRLQLDPASGKQIYAVVYNKSDAAKRKMRIQIAIDGLRVIAARTGLYDGSAEVEDGPDVESDGVMHPEWCRATVWRKGSDHAFVAKVRWSERRKTDRYAQRNNDGNLPLTEFWRDQPYGQLEKCAEAAALRKAFPMEIRGTGVMEDEDDDDSSDERHADAPVTEARVVGPPASADAPPAPSAPPAPVKTPPEVYEVARQIRETMEDPAITNDRNMYRRADDLLQERLDARKLRSPWDAKAEDIDFLKALRDDLQRIVTGT